MMQSARVRSPAKKVQSLCNSADFVGAQPGPLPAAHARPLLPPRRNLMYLPIGHVSEANLRVDQPRVELLREAPPDHLRPVHQNQHAARQQAARAAQKTRASARGACAWCAPSSVSLVARGARAPHRARDETFTQTNRARARPDRPGLDLSPAAQPS